MSVTQPGHRPPAVPATLYSTELLTTFAAGEHEHFLARGGRPLRPRLARALALADLRPGLAVVDIGCGRGEAVLHAARRGAHVTALDFSLGALDLTRGTAGLLPHAARHRVRFVAADAAALPLADGCAERVLLLDVVEHLHSWQLAALLAEVRRILSPSGYVVVHTLPNRWALAVGYRVLRLVAPGLPPEPRSAYERMVHVNEQDPWSLARVLDAAGLAARVWVEEWTSRHAATSAGRRFPDAVRSGGYPALRRPVVRRAAGLAMRSPARWLVANDLFAVAWPAGRPGPRSTGRFRPVR